MELLFSYSSLQLPDIQKKYFGRILTGSPEILKGYKLEKVMIGKDAVISLSKRIYHPAALYTGNNKDIVEGLVYEVTKEELEYLEKGFQVSQYRKVRVMVSSGIECWAYVL